MRKALMIVSAAAMALSMPAFAEKGGKGGGGGGGGKPHKVEHRGGGGGGGGNPHKAEFRGGGGGGKHAERRFEREHKRAERFERAREQRWHGGEKRAERFTKAREKRWEAREKRAENRFKAREKRFEQRAKGREKWAEQRGKAQERRWKAENKRAERYARADERRVEDRVRYRDRADYREDRRGYADTRYSYGGDCPPGLAKKGNGCMPPGLAKKAFGVGQVLPLSYYSDYNIPNEYQSWYQDNPDSYYRYDDSGYIYQVDRESSLIESLIPLLGGGFGVGQLLPSGYDVYNLPTQYRDDFVDSQDASYRYGDDAIYQVDPQSGMIESIVALLTGDLNVGQALPAGYDTYNLPMEYRDDYVDDADSMYRYADGNIYEADPQTGIIEQIVASLI